MLFSRCSGVIDRLGLIPLKAIVILFDASNTSRIFQNSLDLRNTCYYRYDDDSISAHVQGTNWEPEASRVRRQTYLFLRLSRSPRSHGCCRWGTSATSRTQSCRGDCAASALFWATANVYGLSGKQTMHGRLQGGRLVNVDRCPPRIVTLTTMHSNLPRPRRRSTAIYWTGDRLKRTSTSTNELSVVSLSD